MVSLLHQTNPPRVSFGSAMKGVAPLSNLPLEEVARLIGGKLRSDRHVEAEDKSEGEPEGELRQLHLVRPVEDQLALYLTKPRRRREARENRLTTISILDRICLTRSWMRISIFP